MAYSVQFSSTIAFPAGKPVISIQPGDTDNSTSITLPGEGKTDYGQFVDQNILQMLEHFAFSEPPSNAVTGQIWYNPSDNKLRVCVNEGSTSPFPVVANTDSTYPGWLVIQHVGGTPTSGPTNPQCGEMWYKNADNILYVWDCSLNNGHGGWNSITTDTNGPYVRKAGDSMTGFLTLNADPILLLHAATKGYVDTSSNHLQTEIDNIGTVATNASHYLVPAGGIILWSGTIANIPTGWVLCNGQNGTPNLQDRFVVGAGGGYAVGATGGSTTVNINLTFPTTDPHTLVLGEIPSHSHSYGYKGGTQPQSGNATQCWWSDSTQETGAAGGSGAHTHTIGGGGGAVAANVIPPYYALAYIMKT